MDNKFFSKEKQEKAIKWLEEKWGKNKRACEVCGNTQWILTDDLVMPLPYVGGGMILGGNSYPHFEIICVNCGNSKFFNAVITKIVAPSEESKDEQ